MRVAGRRGVQLEGTSRLDRAAFECPGERLGVQLDAIRTDRRRKSNRARIGLDEQAHANAASLQLRDGSGQEVAIRPLDPALLTRNLTRDDWNERALVWCDREHEIHQVGPRVAFDIELDSGPNLLERLSNRAHIVGRNVTGVRPRVNRDPRRAGAETDIDRVQDARLMAAARVAEGCYLVDVDRKTRRGVHGAHKD